MPTYRVTLAELPSRIEKDMRARERRARNAVVRAARRGVKIVKENIPVAFGELEDSIHHESLGSAGARIVADAPHAGAVENGSRPHWPPLDPILRWVRLRGMQGLGTKSQIDRLPGTTTGQHARSIAAQLRAMQRGRSSRSEGAHLPADAALRVAQAIRAAIGKRGTRPHWFVLKSLPRIEEILHEEIQAALPDE